MIQKFKKKASVNRGHLATKTGNKRRAKEDNGKTHEKQASINHGGNKERKLKNKEKREIWKS